MYLLCDTYDGTSDSLEGQGEQTTGLIEFTKIDGTILLSLSLSRARAFSQEILSIYVLMCMKDVHFLTLTRVNRVRVPGIFLLEQRGISSIRALD